LACSTNVQNELKKVFCTTKLIQHGWQQVTSQNDQLQVFQGINDNLGNPIILPLPINDNFIDTPLRLSEAVNLVAFVENRAPESVLIDFRERLENGENEWVLFPATDDFDEVIAFCGILSSSLVLIYRDRGTPPLNRYFGI
jgi:hypothetical protein